MFFTGGHWAGNELDNESWHGDDTLLLRLPQGSSISGEKHMASLKVALRTIIGPIGFRVFYETIADLDANANDNANSIAIDM